MMLDIYGGQHPCRTGWEVWIICRQQLHQQLRRLIFHLRMMLLPKANNNNDNEFQYRNIYSFKT